MSVFMQKNNIPSVFQLAVSPPERAREEFKSNVCGVKCNINVQCQEI